MKGKNTVIGANKVFLSFTLFYLFFQFVLAIVVGVLTAIYGNTDALSFINNNIYGILLINQFVIITIPVLVYVFKKKLDIKEVFKINKLGFKPAALITLLTVPAFFVAAMLNTFAVYLLQFIGDVPTQPIPVPNTLPELVVSILIVGVTPAICEEMMHRGIMLSAYERRGSIRAVFITAIFFGIFHFDITNLLGATFLGLLIGYYVVKTNSIFAGVLAHFLNNALNMLLQYFISDNRPSESVIRISTQDLFGALLFGAVGLILVAFLLALFNKATRGKRKLLPSISTIKNDFVSVISHWPIIIIIIVYLLMAAMSITSIIMA